MKLKRKNLDMKAFISRTFDQKNIKNPIFLLKILDLCKRLHYNHKCKK